MTRLLTLIAAALVALPAVAATLGDDGLHKADWMHDTFKDLREDLDEANAEGKRLALIFEQTGCSYCKKMHEEVFPDPRIDAMLHEDYFVVQLNLHGDIEVTDLDGEVLSEKQAARKWGMLFTPTMIFLPEEVPEDVSAAQAAVAAMPGAFSASTTYDLLMWVKEKRYEDTSEEDFQRYHARMIEERAAAKGD
ncbi:thioredoxin [Rhodobacteraceae bacterium CCMM004]|nr:thioredoxin [Rhodobacteraceae bacterium CCMM004]